MRQHVEGKLTVDDIEIAYLCLLSASAADGGCQPCVQACVDEAVHLHPELPWEQASEQLRPPSTAETMGKAVVSSRNMLAEGSFPDPRAVSRAG